MALARGGSGAAGRVPGRGDDGVFLAGAPASSAVAMLGSTTWRKVCQPSAPRSIDASRREGFRRSRAA